MNIKLNMQKGFTLIELMITIAIVGILAAIAIPSYLSYTEKARFSEVVQAAAALKNAVAYCAHQTGAIATNSVGTIAGCTGNANGIPADIGAAVGCVASVAVANGVITATGTTGAGGCFSTAPATITLTPSNTNGVITWVQVCNPADLC